MQPLQQQFTVSYSYPVHFTSDVFALDNPTLTKALGPKQNSPHTLLCVVDEGLLEAAPGLLERIRQYARHHEDQIRFACPPLVLAGGEAGKNTDRLYERVQTAIHQYGICRQSFVVAVGGGAFLDLVGYAAATAHRGVRLIRMPTTVLAQDDSGVGVKNSVNAFGKKNFIGTFAPPFAVINDVAFLTTLSQRDWIGGIAEAVKVALLKDPAFFDFLERSADALVARDMEAMRHTVHRSAELHLLHIGTGGDPFEATSSRPLDFGHWSAHKLEQLTHFSLRHGEAVAIGLALDTTYSYLLGRLDRVAWQRVLLLLERLTFQLAPPPEISFDALLQGLSEFREHLGGELTITLLRGVGLPFNAHEIDTLMMKHAWEVLSHGASSLWNRTPEEMSIA